METINYPSFFHIPSDLARYPIKYVWMRRGGGGLTLEKSFVLGGTGCTRREM
jgi:hypothetical protein